MGKEVLFSEAQPIIQRGIDKIANAVKATLGPRGQNVVIRHPYGGPPILTKDGVTVAKHIDLDDHIEDIGASLIKEVAEKTVESVGDGTTTATIIAQAIYNQGLKQITAGVNAVELKAGMDIAVKAVVAELQKMSKQVTSLEETISVATISANGDAELGKLIATAIHEVGKDGVVMCKEGPKTVTEVKIISGMQVDRGYSSPYFATDANNKICEMADCFVLISDKKITKMKEILPILEQVVKVGKPILIIADVEGEALFTLVKNKLENRIQVVTVKPPVFWDIDQYQDVAIATGTEVVSDVRGVKLESIRLDQLGRAEKVEVSDVSTIIAVGDGNQLMDERVARLKVDLEKPDADKESINGRIAKLTGGIAVITVGGATEIEVKEKKDRVEDAIFATKAAVLEGIVPGGGLALYRASAILSVIKRDMDKHVGLYDSGQFVGLQIIRSACQEPLRCIISNAGSTPEVVISKMGDNGYNARTGKFEDLMAAGIIDPTKVARLALENAASIMGLLLTTKAFVIEVPKPSSNENTSVRR